MRGLVIAFILAIVILWGVAVAAIWLPVDSRLVRPDAAAAATLTVLAGFRFMLRRQLRDPVVRRLADTVVASQRSALAKTVPLQVVRSSR